MTTAVTVRGDDPRAHDQFFTAPSVAAQCVAFVAAHVPLARFAAVLEPSAGAGAFVDALRAAGAPGVQWADIDAADAANRRDFLAGEPPALARPALVAGNPPFGRNASLAVRFVNRAARAADAVAFVVPRTFRKPSVAARLDPALRLVAELPLPPRAFVFRGAPYDVPAVFRVWVVAGGALAALAPPAPPPPPVRRAADFAPVRDPAAADFAVRRVGVNAGRVFDTAVATRSASSHLFFRVAAPRTPARIAAVVAALRARDLEHLPAKYDTAGCPSLTASDIY
jgi:predicted RNA methylase